MTRNETVVFKILRNGGEYGFIYPKDETMPTLRNRAGGDIKLSLQGTFIPVGYDSKGREIPIDWLTDEIQPVLMLNGESYRLGVLAVASSEGSEDDTASYVNLELYDRSWRIRETKTESILHLPKDANYVDTIEQLLTYCGVNTIIGTPTSLTLKEDREDWEVGTSYLQIVNKLLGEINYKQLYFDASGIAVLQPEEKATVANIKHYLSNRKINPRDQQTVGIISLEKKLTRSMDIYNAPNAFVCSCANPDKTGVMIATAENTNPQSPISIPRRGRRIVEYERVDNIASQTELQKYTDRKRDKSMVSNEVLTVTTLLQPGFGTGEVVGLQLGDDVGQRMDVICLETSWDMQLGVGGLMTHTLERTVYNLD